MGLDCEAYGLKKYGLTRSDCIILTHHTDILTQPHTYTRTQYTHTPYIYTHSLTPTHLHNILTHRTYILTASHLHTYTIYSHTVQIYSHSLTPTHLHNILTHHTDILTASHLTPTQYIHTPQRHNHISSPYMYTLTFRHNLSLTSESKRSPLPVCRC